MKKTFSFMNDKHCRLLSRISTAISNWYNLIKRIHFQGVYDQDCKPVASSVPNFDKGLNAKFAPGYSDFLNDVKKEKEAIGQC